MPRNVCFCKVSSCAVSRATNALDAVAGSGGKRRPVDARRRSPRCSADRLVQQITNAAVDLLSVRRSHAEHREMRPKAVDDAELAFRNELLLGLAVLWREEHVMREQYDQRVRLDATERGLEIAICVQTYVAMPPLPAHPDQIVGVHGQE